MSMYDVPIRRKLMTIMLLTAGAAVLLTCASFFVYEALTFRQTARRQLEVQGEIIAANSTAALAFRNQGDAEDVLAALRAERHIVAACLYDRSGKLFAAYPADLQPSALPTAPGTDGYRFEWSRIVGFQPVAQGSNSRLGTLYIESDTGAMYEMLRRYSEIALLVMAIAFVVAYLVSGTLQSQISGPILRLAAAAKAVSDRQDYSVRAVRPGNDEVGALTDAFNTMLGTIQDQNRELQESADRLERRVAERTAQLESAKQEMEAFAYSVSHDLRAPLRSIDGFSLALLEDCSEQLDAEAKSYLNRVRAACRRMAQLIDDLLALSRVTRTEMVRERVDLSALVQSVASDLRQSQPDRTSEFTITDNVTVIGDPRLLRIAVANLLDNAWKFTGKRPDTRIEFGAERIDGKIACFIRDNGAGFDLANAAQLFGPFQRLHSASEFPGTGIGLATVQRIVRRHGGEVWATAAVGQGATFHFTLPDEGLDGT